MGGGALTDVPACCLHLYLSLARIPLLWHYFAETIIHCAGEDIAQPAHRWALPEFVKQAELEGRQLEQRQDLVEFCRTLCRAILQNSYYSSDHPQARKVVGEPYELIKKLGTSWPEFTFIVTSWRED